MNDISPKTLKQRYNAPVLIEVDGKLTSEFNDVYEVVDVRRIPGTDQWYSIVHCPGGTIPFMTNRVMGITYDY